MVSKISKYKLQANLDLVEAGWKTYLRKAPESAIAYHYQDEREERIYSGSRKYSNACHTIFFFIDISCALWEIFWNLVSAITRHDCRDYNSIAEHA